MKPKDIFSLAVRLLGLAFLYHGLLAVPPGLQLIFFPAGFLGVIMGLLTVGWPLLVAYWLLRGAPLLMRLAYPDTECQSESAAALGRKTS